MSDLISRKAMLEKIRTMQTYKLFSGDDMILVDKAEVQTELMMLPPIQPEQRWIPCSERLPKPWDLVLVTDSYKNISVCQMALNPSDGWYNEYEDLMYFSTRVIAWMPLPEPYQGGD